jgi:hypothetical protein
MAHFDVLRYFGEHWGTPLGRTDLVNFSGKE